MSPDLHKGFRLHDRTVLPQQNRISGGGEDARVEPKTMEVLLSLAEHAGEVVSREFLDEHVWRGSVVTDHALTNCISELRRALGDTRGKPRFIETVPKRGYRLIAPITPLEGGGAVKSSSPSSRFLRFAIPLGLALVLIGVIWWGVRLNNDVSADPLPTVAVAPFRQLHGAEDFAYLQLALPDEITTVLSRSSELAVRPFRPEVSMNPAETGAELDAANLVSGYYYIGAGDKLAITVQAVNLERDRVLWRTQLTVPVQDLLSLRNRIARRIRAQLLPALGAGAARSAGTRPVEAEAYRIYLHSLALPRDPEHNQQAIAMLRQATTLDPSYAPAWAELAGRLRLHSQYGGGGMAALQRAQVAAERALALDPHLIDAATSLILSQAERGELIDAYGRARELVLDNPRSAAAHFALAYTLRYGGMLEDAQRHCRITLELDPHYFSWRSCAFAYLATGDHGTAARFIALDPKSHWAALVLPALAIRRGDEAGALEAVRRLPESSPDRRFLEACLAGRRGSELDALVPEFMERWLQTYDSEPGYWIAGFLLYCGRADDALTMLGRAIDGHYCSYPALDRDPIWDPVRAQPGFQRLRRQAIACHERFRSAIKPPP